jgi:hypothetical protein
MAVGVQCLRGVLVSQHLLDDLDVGSDGNRCAGRRVAELVRSQSDCGQVRVVGSEVKNELQVVAHLSEPLDKYLLQDSTNLERFIAKEMLYGLGLAVEDEILNGDGTESHMAGILATSGIQAVAAGADDVVTLRAALTRLEVAGHAGSVFRLNPGLGSHRGGTQHFGRVRSGRPCRPCRRLALGLRRVEALCAVLRASRSVSGQDKAARRVLPCTAIRSGAYTLPLG